MNKSKALLIIGGMGPEASGYLYKLLIDLAIKEFGAKNNDDFPEIILHSVPVPDFISDDESKGEALKMLKKRVEETNKLSISCISIACNTAHVLLKDLQKVSKVPFISMIEEILKSIKKDNVKVAGLLGTPSTLRFGLYQKALQNEGIEYVTPTKLETNILERIIRNVVAGEKSREDQVQLVKIANNLKKKGAKVIILGCTELPLVFPNKYSLKVYNSVDVLSRALLRIYYRRNTIGS